MTSQLRDRRVGPSYGRVTSLLVVACTALGAAPAMALEAPTEAFVLVVAHNQSQDLSLPALRYADDDAARVYEWASTFASRTELLTVLDAETQRIFPGLVERARLPTRAEVRRAMDELVPAMEAARKRGSRPVFYFYFAGHGDVGADRVGFIHLHDGRFSRGDLFREVIARSTADLNHVIIDACNSYFLVNRRGGAGRPTAEEAMRSFLAEESLERHPNTGVVLSTATLSDSHEWSRYQSGIFSHQLLSALWGTADVDGDQRVTYAELGAYVAAANLRVRDSRARLNLHARAPRRDLAAPLADLRAMRRVVPGVARPQSGKVASVLTIPNRIQGHHYLEDDRGVRYLDFNKSDEQPLRIALLDRPYYYLRSADREAQIRLELAGDQNAGELAFAELPTRSRGAVEQSFRTDLYAFPFGRSFAAGHAVALELHGLEAGATDAAGPRAWYSRAASWKWITLGTSVAGLTAGVTLLALSVQSAGQLERMDLSQRMALDLQDKANRQRLGSGISFGLAGGAALGSLVLFLIDRAPPARLGAVQRPVVGAGLAPGGGTLSLSGRF